MRTQTEAKTGRPRLLELARKLAPVKAEPVANMTLEITRKIQPTLKVHTTEDEQLRHVLRIG